MKKKMILETGLNIIIGLVIIIFLVVFIVNFENVVNTSNYLFLIGVLTTSITTIIVVRNSSKDTSKLAFSQTVSQFRSDWLKKVKENYATFEYLIESFYNDNKLDQHEYKELIVLKNKLIVEFNAYRQVTYDISVRLNKISSILFHIKKKGNVSTEEIIKIKEINDELSIYFNAYFKIEWKRIKNEVNGVAIDFVKEFYVEVEKVKEWYQNQNNL